MAPSVRHLKLSSSKLLVLLAVVAAQRPTPAPRCCLLLPNKASLVFAPWRRCLWAYV